MRIMLPALFASVLLATAPAFAAPCASVTALKLPATTITAAEIVAAGAFRPPASQSAALPTGELSSFEHLPAFCRVQGVIAPSSDSHIEFEVWMPLSGWNGKFLALGNGGFSGEISYPGMVAPLTRGYATASTDTGHEGGPFDSSFALGHPEKWIDWTYRAVHQMTVQSKAILRAYYRNAPRFSYWSGCSTGGRQGLAEAQRFPRDFNGIIAGAPANDATHLYAVALEHYEAALRDAKSFLPPDKLRLLHAAVLKACDARDGVTDGVIEDPERCHIDLQALECRGGDRPDCLTAAQLEAARERYGPLRNSRTHAILFPGLMPGSELGWSAGPGPAARAFATGVFGNEVFQDPHWDYRTLSIDQIVARADHSEAALANDIDPNLGPFFARGGKLIQYHGWADPGVSPLNSIDYYRSVARAMGGANRIATDYRLFMVPGMGHCRGGDGTDQFEAPMLTALDQWVEHGRAPDRIIASRIRDGRVDRARPLCPYPEVAAYKGSGSTNVAANFACRRAR